MVCGFTGHRPEKLPWGYAETDPRCKALKLRLRQVILEQITDGADVFLCGMARGCDFYFAEAVLELKAAGHAIRLEAMLPCPEQAERWPLADRERYEGLRRRCDAVYLLEDAYTDGCMLRRNRAMVKMARRLISVWDGSHGGTEATVRYAGRLGVDVVPLWL